MKVTLVADSCFLFEHDGLRILTDPWIGTRIYGGAWRQFPPPTISASELGKIDFLFISHIHEDHCDFKTIAQIDRSAEVLLLKRPQSFVKRALDFHQLKFDSVREINLGERYRVSGSISFEVLDSDPKHSLNHLIDSSLLIHYGQKAILFANDNLPYEEQYPYLRGLEIELAVIPGTGGSGYPAFYSNFEADEKEQRASELRTRSYQAALKCVREIRPNSVVFAAGGHVLAGRNANYNKYMAWSRSSSEPYEFLLSDASYSPTCRALLLRPGDCVELSGDYGATLDDAVSFYQDRSERERFLRAESEEACPYFFEVLELSPSVNLERIIQLSCERLSSHLLDTESALCWQIIVSESDGKAFFSYDTKDKIIVDPAVPLAGRNTLRMTMDKRLLVCLFTGIFSWNIADAAGFIEYERLPDVYDPDLYIALNYLRI